MAYILLADDELEAVEIAAGRLRQEGHRTVVVTDGRAAIARVREAVPDILVTDLMMPFADGFMVIRELCRVHPEKRVPVILLAALGADGQPLRMPEAGPVISCITRQGSAQELADQILLSVHMILHARSQG
jgi:CheY-like chemotaxis protein